VILYASTTKTVEEPLRYEAITGLDREQLTELTARVHARLGGWTSNGRPFALGLFNSVTIVVALLRENLTQSCAGAFFGVSQSTVSRRWDLLRPLIEPALAEFVPTPAEVAGTSSVLVDGTLIPTWDWKDRDDLYSGRHADHGLNTAAVVRDRRRVGAGQGGGVSLGRGAAAAIMTGCDTRSGRGSRCRYGS
jgi:hypothetical protein